MRGDPQCLAAGLWPREALRAPERVERAHAKFLRGFQGRCGEFTIRIAAAKRNTKLRGLPTGVRVLCPPNSIIRWPAIPPRLMTSDYY